MATVRVSFDVYDVPDSDTGTTSVSVNALLDKLSTVETDLVWDDADWEEVA